MRLRLLHLVLFVGALLLSVKVGDLWHGLSIDAGSQSAAQTAPAGAPAADAAPPPPADAAAPPSAEAAETSAAAATAPNDPFAYSDEEMAVLQSLAARRGELDAREAQIAEREALLAAAENRMDEKTAELKALQDSIQGLVGQHDEQEQAQFKSLVKIYENMKPKDAAKIFEELEMDVLLEVVGRMREQKVAPILAQMQPTKAKDVTFELAQRRQLPIPK